MHHGQVVRPLVVVCLAVSLSASALLAQPSFDKAFEPATIGPGSVSAAVFTIINETGSPLTSLSFTDVLPGPVTIAEPANVVNECPLAPGGSVDAPAGGDTISLSGGRLAVDSSCTISVDVTSSAAGVHTNPAVTLTSSGGPSMSTAVTLTVDLGRPGFTKSFSPGAVSLGGRSTLTLTIDNSANAGPVESVVFTDNFPTGLEIADPPNAASDCGGPEPQLTVGNGFVAFSSFGSSGEEILLAGETCTVTVDVVATAGDALENVTSALSTDIGNSGKASATLDASVAALNIRKAFLDDPVQPGSTVELEFNLENFDRDFSASEIAFTDDLAATLPGLVIESELSNDCSGTVGGVGTSLLAFTGGFLPAQGSCTIRVRLDVPAGGPGAYENVTGAVEAMVGGSPVVGNTASDTLFVETVPRLSKAFLDDPADPGGTVTIEFTVTNTSSSTSATGITFADPFPTVLPTAAVTPGDGCCGAGSICRFTALENPPPPEDVVPALFELEDGFLAPAGTAGDSCTFQLTLDVDSSAAGGLYVNTTTPITATVDGVEQTGEPAVDELIVTTAPRLVKEFLDDPSPPGGTLTLGFTLGLPGEATGPATDITFSDDLAAMGAGLTANLPPSPDPPCGAGSQLTATAGDTLLTLTGGTLQPGGECSFTVDLDIALATTVGTYTNTTSPVTAIVDGIASASGPVSDDVLISGLSVSKEFLGDPVIPGEEVTLRFTLENDDPVNGASNIVFEDRLADVLPETPDLSIVTSLPFAACGGTLLSIEPPNLLFAGGSIAQGDPPCTFDVVLEVPAGADDGTYVNTTDNPTADVDGTFLTLPPATAELEIDSMLIFLQKEFIDDPVPPGNAATLRFRLENLDADRALTGITFSDDLGAALSGLFATGLPISGCGGTLAASPDGSNVLFTGGSLPPGGSCEFDVSVAVPAGAAAGEYTNTTSTVGGQIDGLAVHGGAASDNLLLLDLLNFSKSFDGPTMAGAVVELAFTIENPGEEAVADLSFSDNLDAVLLGLVATGLPQNDVCGAGSLLAGTDVVTLTGASLPAKGGECTFSVNVQMPVVASGGDYLNTTSELTASGLAVAPPATATLTVLVGDEDPPLVTAVETVAGDVATPLLVCDTVRSPLEVIDVTIEDTESAVLGAGDATGYQLLAAGPDGDFSTAACGAPSGDDVAVPLLAITASGQATVSARLLLSGGVGLAPGLYRFFVCDTIADAAGNNLDGDADGTPGGDFSVPFFRADPYNLFENGHFDECPAALTPWMVTATPPNAVQIGPDDHVASPLSSSAQVVQSTGGGTSIGQCVAIAAPGPHRLAARIRYVPSSLEGGAPTLTATCELFDAAACGGSSLGLFGPVEPLVDEGGIFIAVEDEGDVPAGAVSALCDFAVDSAAGGFELDLDALFFGVEALLFTDGFESGDTGTWDATFP